MTRSGKLSDYIVAAVFVLAAAVISPFGIELITGRPELSFRINVISLTFVGFLLVIAAAILAQGWLRRGFFYAVVLTFPFAVLAGLEAGAVSLRLADRVAPLEDTSLLANKAPWPTHLLSDASYYTTRQGFVLYHPWQGNGIAFNALGLRTAMPAPKRPGEWRVAVTGGSLIWGWHVLDRDTIPVQMQEIFRRSGHANVTVYNFGIGGATLKQELALLKHFREAYGIDQVLFFTGANDVFLSYLNASNKNRSSWLNAIGTLELVKLVLRLRAMGSTPSPQRLAWIETEVLEPAVKMNSLRRAVVAANEYCRAVELACDFALQPMMSQRKTHSGAEAEMARILARVYPQLDVLTERMYRDAMAAGPAGRTFDLSAIFDDTPQPFFLDFVHLNEAGNRIAAERVAPIVEARLP